MNGGGAVSRAAQLAILGLILGGLATACTESTIISLLPTIGQSLGVTVESSLGYAITFYMVGVVCGAPLFTVVLVRLNRKMLLILAVCTQVVGNLMTVFAPNFTVLLLGRFLTGVPHGAIYGLMALVGAYLAPPGKVARYVSLSFIGAPIANLAMVPLMTFVGQSSGYRTAFGIIAGIGLLAVVAMWRWLPPMEDVLPTNPKQEMALFRNRQVMLTLVAGLIGFSGFYGFLSYIALSVESITGMDPRVLPFVMMTMGVGSVVGTLLAGQLSDRYPQAAFPSIMAGFLIALAVAPLMAQSPITMFLEVFLVGTLGSGAFPQAMQVRLINHAGESQNFAASLNHASLCMANGIGSYMSTLVVGAQLGGVLMYAIPATIGAGLALVGLGVLLVAVWLVKSGRDASASADTAQAVVPSLSE